MLKKVLNRLRRKAKVRAKLSGTTSKPRLSIYRSNSNIYAQIIDDTTGKTLAASSDLKMKKEGTKVEMAKKVGADIASKAKGAKVKEVVFDRGGFAYHGRVKALAEGARENGLTF